MSGKRVYLLLVTMIASVLVVAACTEKAVPTQEPLEFQPTAAASIDRPDSSEDSAGSPAEAAETGTGDAEAGRNLFTSCSGCHSTGTSQLVGPGLGGVYARAGERTSLDADAYIIESLQDPGAFVVDGFPPVMPSFSYLGDDDIQNLIAYLKTLE